MHTRLTLNGTLVTSITAAFVIGSATSFVSAQPSTIPPSLITPNKVQTSIGTLEFQDGAPTKATADKVRDALDFTRALNVYNNSSGAHRHTPSQRASRASAPMTIPSSSSPI